MRATKLEVTDNTLIMATSKEMARQMAERARKLTWIDVTAADHAKGPWCRDVPEQKAVHSRCHKYGRRNSNENLQATRHQPKFQ